MFPVRSSDGNSSTELRYQRRGCRGNNRGIVGLLPVAATALYTAGCYYAVKIRTIKINMIVNLVLFAIYDVFILDLVSAVVDAVSAVLAAISLLRPEE